jgi:hypothetical protein
MYSHATALSSGLEERDEETLTLSSISYHNTVKEVQFYTLFFQISWSIVFSLVFSLVLSFFKVQIIFNVGNNDEMEPTAEGYSIIVECYVRST